MSKISWVKTDSTFRRMEGDIENLDVLPKGIYTVGCGLAGWYLTKTADKFTFNFKLYNLQRSFLDYAKKTYFSTSGNLGILFNGTRGTGKTISAKILANELNLPIILVEPTGDDNSGLITYLSSFNFDCIFFFDEFEKKFSDKDCSILQIMDGVYNSDFRKVFLLTTNELTVNQNLLSRPSRIRYVVEFGNLTKDVVNEYLENNLKDKSCKEDLMDYVDTLTISTIDILKAIVEEVNIHGISDFLVNKKVFNVTNATYNYRTYRGTIDKEKANDLRYDIERFLYEVDRYKNRYEYNQAYKEALALAKGDKEREEIIEAFNRESTRYAYIGYNSVNEDKLWSKLTTNDCFYDEKVLTVNVEKNVVVTLYGSELHFYYIENPNEKPSLYSPKSDLYKLSYVL